MRADPLLAAGYRDLTPFLSPVSEIATEAGALILDYYQQGNFSTTDKQDDTPVTEVDFAASDLLVQRLQSLSPRLPVLTEEAQAPWSKRRHWASYWLVDPLDGTKEFIAGRDEFAVCIALVRNGEPQLGVIYAPVSGLLYRAVQGGSCERLQHGQVTEIRVRQLARPEQDPLQIAVSRSQNTAKITRRLHPDRPVDLLPVGSCALKSCLVAEGGADAYVRIGPTGEWDTAAPQVIVQAAGGQLLSETFQPLSYNQKADLENPDFYVLGDPRVNWQQVLRQPD